MKTTLVPGYREIFGDKTGETYDSLVAILPSSLVIHLSIILNGELNTPVDGKITQQRLISMMSHRYSAAQNRELNLGFERYRRKTGGKYTDVVFGRRYLIAMVLKELNNYRQVVDDGSQSVLQEYHFLKAYMLVIDEVNDRDNALFNAAKLDKNDPLSKYKLLWTPNLNQFEFSERTNVVYETFKLMGFFIYAMSKLRPYLKTYLSNLGFKSVGQLLGSLNQVAMSAEKYYPDEVFKMLTYVAPDEHVDQTHLRSQLISQAIGQEKGITLFDIKKFPLYYYQPKGYMPIDADLYKKKTYLGPFFDLCKTTTLEKDKGFNAYSGEIAYHVLEQVCFQTVLTQLRDRDKGFLHVDDGSDSIPDGYYREGNTIFLCEFKANLFPSDLASNPDFEKVKNFIDTRLVKSEKEKKKGIGQLKQQIETIADGTFQFDGDFKKAESKKRIKIYPVISHTEFHFGLPGINNYLNDLFQNSLSDEIKKRFDIRPLTVINLEVLFDYAVRLHYFKSLAVLIDRYHQILKDRTKRLATILNQESYWRAHMSFDELYHSLYITEINKAPQHRLSFKGIVSSMGIQQEQLDEEIT